MEHLVSASPITSNLKHKENLERVTFYCTATKKPWSMIYGQGGQKKYSYCTLGLGDSLVFQQGQILSHVSRYNPNEAGIKEVAQALSRINISLVYKRENQICHLLFLYKVFYTLECSSLYYASLSWLVQNP